MKDRLETFAREAGFAAIRVTRPDAVPQAAARLADFVARGHHGQMGWMAERMHWRGNPAALWPEARSVIMLAENYAPDHDVMAGLELPERAVISCYAQGRDYHDVVKKRLKKVGRWLIEQAGGEIKVFVDTAPVMEKPLAASAGLGWQGKHTNLVSRELGSWFFLGAIFTTLEIEPDGAEVDHCGSCTACLDICPTKAFPAPYQLDARRCVSYLTIEHRGPVDTELRAQMGNRIYGCDDCLAVCPWNKFAQTARDMRLAGDGSLVTPPLAELAYLDDTAFRTKFSGSPIKRIGVLRFLRNVGYAIGNSGRSDLTPAAAHLAQSDDPSVADAGAWALARLAQK